MRRTDKNLVLVVSYNDVLSIIHWKKAVGLVVTDKATMVETNGRPLRSQHISWQMPEVIQLTRSIPPRILKPQFSRRTVLERDQYTCQYCGAKPMDKKLQVDHVLPKSRGGTSTYTNCVTACAKCNHRKSNKTPEEAHMKLSKPPTDLKATTLAGRLKLTASRHIKASWEKWIDYFS